LHGNLEQACSLAEDQLEIFFLIDQVAKLLHLDEFAFDHLLGERDEQVEHVKVAFFKRRAKALHVEPVAGQNAFRVPPGGV
jgi:hypothetical protein